MELGKNKNTDIFGAEVKKANHNREAFKMRGLWKVACFAPDGTLKWEEQYENIVVDQGLDYALGLAVCTSGNQESSWYIGLASGSPSPAAADTMASHGGWGEFTSYTESARQAWTHAGVSAKSATNSASTADFTINANSSTIGGAFLVSDSAKAGSSGLLYAAGAFSGGNKAADSGDTLSVTATFTSADDGV